MERPDLALFDCVPVTTCGRVIGVLERNGVVSGSARKNMRRLDDGLLVSSDEPLKAFIPLLVETPHRLVVRGARIEGIVTSSDVHKLPVRLLAFALITHLEMTMAAMVLSGKCGEDWINLLSRGRRTKVRQKLENLRTESFDPPVIELTDFCDKRDVLATRGLLDYPTKSEAVAAFKRIESLRNSVAHAAGLRSDRGSACELRRASRPHRVLDQSPLGCFDHQTGPRRIIAGPRVTGMASLPLRHLSIRVPWHDNAWNGTVCSNPEGERILSRTRGDPRIEGRRPRDRISQAQSIEPMQQKPVAGMHRRARHDHGAVRVHAPSPTSIRELQRPARAHHARHVSPSGLLSCGHPVSLDVAEGRLGARQAARSGCRSRARPHGRMAREQQLGPGSRQPARPPRRLLRRVRARALALSLLREANADGRRCRPDSDRGRPRASDWRDR